MSAFVLQPAASVATPAPTAALRTPHAGAAPSQQTGPSVPGLAIAGAGLLAAVAPAVGQRRAARRCRATRVHARGGNAAALTEADLEKTTDAETAMVASRDGAGLAVPEESKDEDVSSRVRYLAPLLPLAVFPAIQAKESAQRNMELMVSTSAPGSQMYHMAGWTPDVASPCYESIYRWFPKAMPATPVFERSKLFMTKLGLDPSNTLFGSSLCPDEINNKKGGTLDQMTRYWGEQFPLGGLGGVPLVGKTGWGAFSHHTPDNGNIFVIYGPHVGVSEEGVVGKILRPGQPELTSACGAFVGAYKQTEKWGGQMEEMDGSDMQQQFIRNNLGLVRPEIAASANPMAELAYKAFDIVDKQMNSIVDLDCCDKLVLLGGIQVNTPEGFPDHFVPLKFQAREKGKAPRSLMKAFAPALDPNALIA